MGFNLQEVSSRRDFLQGLGALGGSTLLAKLTEINPLESFPSPPIVEAADPFDFPLENGWHFTQTVDKDKYPEGHGYSIQGKMWEIYQSLGGMAALGPVISQKYIDPLGRETQATQVNVIQHNPQTGQIEFLNVYDELGREGFDPNHEEFLLIPPSFGWESDRGKPWGLKPEIIPGTIEDNHIRRVFGPLRDNYPQLEARYFSNPNWFRDYGLPVSYHDYGKVVVVTCQRIAFQLWKDKTDWTNGPLEITPVLGGELAKKYGLIPPEALVPQPVKENKKESFPSKIEGLDPFESLNLIRLDNGRPALLPASVLYDVALEQTWRVMKQKVDTGQFSHYRVDGNILLYDVLRERGIYNVGDFTEVLGLTNSLPEEVTFHIMNGFKDSPAHMSTILRGDLNTLGVGIAPGPDGFHYLAAVMSKLPPERLPIGK